TTAPENYDFGLSNPPADIWDARERLLSGEERDGDRGRVLGFINYHFVPREGSRTGEDEGEQNSSLATSSEDSEAQMMELAEGMEQVALEAGSGEEGTLAGGYEGVADDDDDALQELVFERGGTEAEMDAVIERDLNDAFDDMEMEGVVERVAGLVIDDDDVGSVGGNELSRTFLRLTETEYADCRDGSAGGEAAEQWGYDEL
ncbi:MAG: hypothetical protein Q9223_006391, partial [Gallowayella weberi]